MKINADLHRARFLRKLAVSLKKLTSTNSWNSLWLAIAQTVGLIEVAALAWEVLVKEAQEEVAQEKQAREEVVLKGRVVVDQAVARQAPNEAVQSQSGMGSIIIKKSNTCNRNCRWKWLCQQSLQDLPLATIKVPKTVWLDFNRNEWCWIYGIRNRRPQQVWQPSSPNRILAESYKLTLRGRPIILLLTWIRKMRKSVHITGPIRRPREAQKYYYQMMTASPKRKGDATQTTFRPYSRQPKAHVSPITCRCVKLRLTASNLSRLTNAIVFLAQVLSDQGCWLTDRLRLHKGE